MSGSTEGEAMNDREREIEELLLHLRGLVFVRAILEQRGAPEGELERHASEITRVRADLARTAQVGAFDQAA
jgi:hypothetical protein